MKNICVVGYGNIGPAHAAALETVENANLYAVCDIDPSKLEAAKAKYSVQVYTDFDEMLQDTAIDVVHICTPHYLHYEMIVKALTAGKGVVSEKPVVMTKEQFNRLQQVPGIDQVCLVFQNRLNPCAEMLKELCDSKRLGEIKCAKGIVTWIRTDEYYNSGAWRGKWETEGGGVLINQSIHTMDMLHYLVGTVKSVKANMANYSLTDVIEVEDTMTARLEFANGAVGMFFATNAYGVNNSPDIEIVFEHGDARYVHDTLYVNGEIVCHDVVATGEKAYWGLGHSKLFHLYYDEGSYFSISDVVDTMNTVFATYESAKNGGKEVLI